MRPQTVYSTKAEIYAKYRWDYAPEAIDKIIRATQLSAQSCIADIGAGTGILTRHFAGRVKRVYAIEPNAEMRQFLKDQLGSTPTVLVQDSCAEATGLDSQSIDVITVAQAIHWFNPEPARDEMQRILKNNGWLVLLRNYGTDEISASTGRLMTAEYGANFSALEKPKEKPVQFYYGTGSFQRLIYPFQFKQNWAEFFGALISASFMPDENHPLFRKLKIAAQEIFTQFSDDGRLNGTVTIHGETELIIGQPS